LFWQTRCAPDVQKAPAAQSVSLVHAVAHAPIEPLAVHKNGAHD
jgi:hypothetical protein